MELTLFRKKFSRWGTTGVLWIEDEMICSTVEHPQIMLPPGRYELKLRANPKAGVKCLMLKDYPHTGLLPANGPFRFRGSCSIAIGKRELMGVLTECKETAAKLSDRMRKVPRKEKIWLEII